MKKIIFGLSFFIGVMMMMGTVMAASVSFYSNSVTVLEGNSFSSAVSINPGGEKIYSVKVVLDYPVDKMEVTGFNFADGWMSGFSPEDKIDNQNGVLVKTAGWPGGTSDIKSFGTISFKSKTGGVGEVNISSDSMLLNGQNVNTISLANPAITVTINEPEIVTETIPEPEVSTVGTEEVIVEVSSDEEVVVEEDGGEETTSTEEENEILMSKIDLEDENVDTTLLATAINILGSSTGITLIILIIVGVSIGITVKNKKKKK